MSRKFLTAIDLTKNELQNARVQNLASAPSSPVAGQIYYDTTNNKLYWYNATATAWVAADGSSVTFGSVSTEQAFGVGSANGAATTVARSDHTHGNPAHTAAIHQELIATADLTDWPRVAALDLNSQKITGLADPTLVTDAATKQYVDSLVNGLDWKASVRVSTTAALPTNTRSGNVLTASANAIITTIDGVTVAVNDRILVKNEATSANNGLYTVTAVGSAGTPWILTRATDADSSAEVTPGTSVFVEEGTSNGNQQWALTTDAPITLNTTGLVFAQVGAQGTTPTAGAGLTLTSNTYDVGQGTGITVAADSIAIDTAVVVRKFAVTIGDASATAIAVTHSLGTLDVIVTVYEVATGAEVDVDVVHTSTTVVTVTFGVAPALNSYRVVVHA